MPCVISRPGEHLQRRRKGVVIRLQGGIAVWKRTALDQCQPELGRRFDDLLRPVDVRDARELHQNLIVLGVSRDDGLGDAELIDAPLDRVERLLDDVPREVARGGRLHAKRVRAVPLDPVEGSFRRRGHVAEPQRVVDAVDAELVRTR